MLDYRLVRLLPGPQPRICAAPKNARVSSGPRRDSGSQRHGVTNDCTLRERGKSILDESHPEITFAKFGLRG